MLTLAVPGSAPAAVLLAAMFIHGVRPGPLIMIENPTFVFEVAAMLFWASLAILILGLALTRPMLFVLRVPREYLMPVIFVLCVVGSFAIASRIFDVWVMLGFGIFGFALRQMNYPMAPLVLGIVLGDILDKNFRRGMVLSDGSFEPFVTRPIAGGACRPHASHRSLGAGAGSPRRLPHDKEVQLKLSLCNEVIRDLPFPAQCAFAASVGYDGLELAPFTLSDDPETLGEAEARRVRAAMEAEGLGCSGLHWLLVGPEGLSITSEDAGVRRRTTRLHAPPCRLHRGAGRRPADPRLAAAAHRAAGGRRPKPAPAPSNAGPPLARRRRRQASSTASSRCRGARRGLSTPSPRRSRYSRRSAAPAWAPWSTPRPPGATAATSSR